MTVPPPRPERVIIAGPAGALEAVVEARPEAGGALGVICHPHPLYGGTLDNKVVHTVARAFQESGAATVRFNFRGVGESAGQFDDGPGEVEDTVTVVEWGRSRWPAGALWLAGFSFGGAIAMRVAATLEPQLLVSVAPAVQRVDVGPSMPDCPWLILQGDLDDVVSCRDVEAWATRHAPHAELVVLQGAGHYFHGRLPELRDAVSAFVARVKKKSPARS